MMLHDFTELTFIKQLFLFRALKNSLKKELPYYYGMVVYSVKYIQSYIYMIITLFPVVKNIHK